MKYSFYISIPNITNYNEMIIQLYFWIIIPFNQMNISYFIVMLERNKYNFFKISLYKKKLDYTVQKNLRLFFFIKNCKLKNKIGIVIFSRSVKI